MSDPLFDDDDEANAKGVCGRFAGSRWWRDWGVAGFCAWLMQGGQVSSVMHTHWIYTSKYAMI